MQPGAALPLYYSNPELHSVTEVFLENFMKPTITFQLAHAPQPGQTCQNLQVSKFPFRSFPLSFCESRRELHESCAFKKILLLICSFPSVLLND